MKTKLFESLESRQLMADFSAAVNFQPAAAPRAPGLLIDYGSTYDVRRGGLSYGWSSELSANTVDRNLTPIQRNDTFIVIPQGAKWEIAVPNGQYSVYLVSGDLGQINERMGINVEGTTAISGITRKAKPFIEGQALVTVSDGRLTIEGAPWVTSNKLNYLAIKGVDASDKTLSITASIPTAKEAGRVAGEFTITRGGDLSQAITVPLTVGGSATNSMDYGRVGKAVVFAAGVSTIKLKIAPATDTFAEGNETVSITLGNVAGYAVTQPSAQVVITDASSGTPAASSFTWQAVAQPAVGHVEAESAIINGKVYVFSGYQGSYIPGPRVDVFDMATRTWTRKNDMPVPLTHAATAVVGTDVWFAGGYIQKPGNPNSQQTYYKGVFRYDSLTDTWHTGKELPDFRGSSGMIAYGRKLYLFSGDDKNRINPRPETWVLDLDNQAAGWKTLAPIPKARTHFGIVEINGFVYIIGGQKGIDETSVHYADSYKYDIANNTWTRIADFPTVISHISPSTFEYNGRIIVAGGESGFNDSLSNVREYNPETNTWRSLSPIPLKRAAGIAHAWGTEFFFTGGKDGNFARETWVADVG